MNNEQKLKQALQELDALKSKIEGLMSCEDKFAELKEAHKNGAVIQIMVSGTWEDMSSVIFWDAPIYSYRIKPKEEPNVGDIVKVWDAKEGKFFIGTLYKKGIYDVPYPFMVKLYNSRDDYNFYGNAEKITKQEAIELLFGKENEFNQHDLQTIKEANEIYNSRE